MLFHTLEFAIFFPIVFTLYLILPHKWQNRMLLVASYVFYGAWDWRFLFLLLLTSVVDYYVGILISNTQSQAHRTRYLQISLASNLLLLGIFKYYDFFAASFQALMARAGIEVDVFLLSVILPVGISFYTFQSMSYTIDVYWKKMPACRSLPDFLLFVSFFPQLVAGPIERAGHLLPQMIHERKVEISMFLKGVYLFFWGLFLKVFMADNMAKIVDPVFQGQTYDGSQVLLASYAFSFQIYGDFAGYSFMAIGLGWMLGVDLMENFRRPYFSKNMGEFWRRWHISLSTWFRDYLYIPLGGNRVSRVRWMFNIWLTFLICGLWHGANWTFVVFGIYNAVAVLMYFFLRKYWDVVPSVIQILITYHLICIGWIIFRSVNLEQSIDMLHALLFNFQWNAENTNTAIKLVGYASVLLVVQIFQEMKNETLIVFKMPRVFRYAFYTFLATLILAFGEFSDRPFIYFQF